jgi:porin
LLLQIPRHESELPGWALTNAPYPIRSNETLLEIIYEAHIKPGWLLAPYFQYVWRPSGGIPNPLDPTGTSKIGDAAIFGVTSTLKF